MSAHAPLCRTLAGQVDLLRKVAFLSEGALSGVKPAEAFFFHHKAAPPAHPHHTGFRMLSTMQQGQQQQLQGQDPFANLGAVSSAFRGRFLTPPLVCIPASLIGAAPLPRHWTVANHPLVCVACREAGGLMELPVISLSTPKP